MSNMPIAYAVGCAVEGFGTLDCKSFSITGRVPNLGPGAVRSHNQISSGAVDCARRHLPVTWKARRAHLCRPGLELPPGAAR